MERRSDTPLFLISPSQMRRPASVTLSAIVAIVGSLGTALFGAMMLAAGETAGATADPSLAGARTVARLSASGFALFSVAGAWTAVGLLRSREWARVATIIFGGVLVMFSVLSGALILIVPLHEFTDLEPEMVAMVRPALIAFYAVPCAIGLWWLVLFNRANIRAFFEGTGEPDALALPVSISLIAWACLIGGAASLVPLLLPIPFHLFGLVATGSIAKAIYLSLAVLQAYIGWGLLERSERARRVGIAFFGYTVLHGALMLLVPSFRSSAEEFAITFASRMDPQLGDAFSSSMWWASVPLLIGLAAPVWILLRWHPKA